MDIIEEASTSYMEYALSVIISRALPDIRDGLKPVQRRILYAMEQDSLYPTSPHVKSVSIVGDTLKKFHPHGDSSVYEAMVHMAQDFDYRYPLVDGQGNFGSLNNTDAAAPRYTEARMSQHAFHCITNIKENVVDFVDNFDGRYQEPTVLPVEFPTLLCNGTFGIAVGMSSSIPSHNLNEVIDATIALIKNPNIKIEGLLKHIKGPDFPSGGYILGTDNIKEAYLEGTSILILQAKISIEDRGNNAKNLIVSELPHGVSSDKIETQISALKAQDDFVLGVADVANLSDNKRGTHLVIEIAKNHNPDVVLKHLLEKTSLRINERVSMRVIDGGVPKIANLKDILQAFVEFRFDIVTKFTEHRLKQAEHTILIQEGFNVVLQDIDNAVAIIRKANDKAAASQSLQKKYKLTAEQVDRVLEMPLSRLTKMEISAIKKRIAELSEEIKEYKALLGDKKQIAKYIIAQLNNIKEELGDDRRSEIIDGEPEKVDVADLVGSENVVVSISKDGYVKRTPLSEYKTQKRGGKGSTSSTISEEDFVSDVLIAPVNQGLLFFTNQSKVYYQDIYRIPQAARRAKGVHLNSVLVLGDGEVVKACVPIKDWGTEDALLLVTTKGVIKKTKISEYSSVVKRNKGLIAFGLSDDDEICRVLSVGEDSDIFIITQQGNCVRFASDIVRGSGRQASGVKGIQIGKNDIVIDAGAIEKKDKNYLLTISAQGKCKRSKLSEYAARLNRGGSGIKAVKLAKDDVVASIEVVSPDDSIIVVTSANKTLRYQCSEIKETSRVTQGVNLIQLDDGDSVVETSVVKI